MPIERGDVVTLEYVGRTSDGTVFDSSRQDAIDGDAMPANPSPPLQLEIGAERIVSGPGQIVEAIEPHLLGVEEGQTVTVSVPPENAYGQASESAVHTFDRSEIQQMNGDEVRAGTPMEGMSIRTPDGRVGEIVGVTDDSIEVDFNQPLAGETLEFELTVTDVQ